MEEAKHSMTIGVLADAAASVAIAAELLALGIGIGAGVGLGTTPAPPLGENESLALDEPAQVNPRRHALYTVLAVVASGLVGAIAYLLTRVPGNRIAIAVTFALPGPSVLFWLAIAAGLLGGFLIGWLTQRLLLAAMVLFYVRAQMLLDRFQLAIEVAFSMGAVLGFLLGLNRGVAGGFASGVEVGLIAAFLAYALILRRALRSPKPPSR